MSTCFATVVTQNTTCMKNHYAPFLETLLHSMAINSACNDIPFIVFSDGLTEHYKIKLKRIWKNIYFEHVNIFKYAATIDKHNAKYWSFEAFNLKEYSRVIFLDCDTMCLKPLTELIAMDVEIGMARELRRACWNAGVIVLNKSILHDGTYEKLFDHEAPADFGNDQKIYNNMLKDRITSIEQRWNTLVTEINDLDSVHLIHYIHKVNNGVGREHLDAKIAGMWLDMYFDCEMKYGY